MDVTKLNVLSLMIFSSALIASAAPVTLSLQPSPGSVTGNPGATVGWGFSLTNATNDFLVVANSYFCEAGQNPSSTTCSGSLGTYSDFIASHATVVDPSGSLSQAFSLAAGTGFGSYQISSSAGLGQTDSGSVVLVYDLFNGDPFTGPATQVGGDASVTVPAGVTVGASGTAVPEPALPFASSLGLLGVFGIRWLVRYFSVSRAISASVLLVMVGSVSAQVVPPPAMPQVGSSNPATAEPSVPRPSTQPCTVTLFQNVAFETYTPYTYSYTPPSQCSGPWSKVVFSADFTVPAGFQYDRTAAFYLGHANVYYGTTAEPTSTLSPSWHVERDVTDLASIFKNNQTGQADLGTFAGTSGGLTYVPIYATAQLLFYPATWYDPIPETPDMVVPINGPGGDAGQLRTTTDQITETMTLPRNVERLYLDVISQSQAGDEFWYFCVPNDLPKDLRSCGNTGFRETEIYVDGKPAGVAPVSPWIYTGGVNPNLWQPIVGVQTLEFKPYRVDLTPFAGLFDDGQPHTVAVSVYNANSYFLATANLLVYQDHGSGELTGALTTNTLSNEPAPVITENISNPSKGVYNGSVKTVSNRVYQISGYVNTSHGKVQTTVDSAVSFVKTQNFMISSAVDRKESFQQSSTVHTVTSVQDGWTARSIVENFKFPLSYSASSVGSSDNFESSTEFWQTYELSKDYKLGDLSMFHTSSEEHVHSQATSNEDSSGAPTSVYSSNAFDKESDSQGRCYYREIKSENQVLTEVKDRPYCPIR